MATTGIRDDYIGLELIIFSPCCHSVFLTVKLKLLQCTTCFSISNNIYVQRYPNKWGWLDRVDLRQSRCESWGKTWTPTSSEMESWSQLPLPSDDHPWPGLQHWTTHSKSPPSFPYGQEVYILRSVNMFYYFLLFKFFTFMCYEPCLALELQRRMSQGCEKPISSWGDVKSQWPTAPMSIKSFLFQAKTKYVNLLTENMNSVHPFKYSTVMRHLQQADTVSMQE